MTSRGISCVAHCCSHYSGRNETRCWALSRAWWGTSLKYFKLTALQHICIFLYIFADFLLGWGRGLVYLHYPLLSWVVYLKKKMSIHLYSFIFHRIEYRPLWCNFCFFFSSKWMAKTRSLYQQSGRGQFHCPILVVCSSCLTVWFIHRYQRPEINWEPNKMW